MISAINGANLGVTASYTTAQVAGAVNGTTGTSVESGDLGIMITGSAGAGGAPSATSFSGVITGVSTSDTAGADVMSGSITLQEGNGSAATITMAQVAAAAGAGASSVTMADLATYISSDKGLGVSAEVNTTSGDLSLTSGSNTGTTGLSSSGTVTSNTNTLKVTDNLTDAAVGTSGTATSYTANSAYAVGIGAGTNVYDVQHSSVAVAGLAAYDTAAGTLADATAGSSNSSGVATISYSDSAGASLNTTDLTNQANAQIALTGLNTAITDVAAQDGYVGAQINTLNAVSSVLSTQQENVTSAQNAVQATDYASATSNMSKYEILSQTGISALAQANSMSQEVTKLLQ